MSLKLKLILASSSKYRAEQLKKLNIPYHTIKPSIDEAPQPQERPKALVQRLSEQKARTVIGAALDNKATDFFGPEGATKDIYIIGSDQVAVHRNRIIGKPGNHTAATEQLQKASGQTLEFFTGLTLIHLASQQAEHYLETTRVTFRKLKNSQIESYLSLEKPYDCAGSFKSEGMGICLIEKIEGRDPNALIGLPLIGLLDLLQRFGVHHP